MNEQEETNSRLVSRLVGMFFFFRREKRTLLSNATFLLNFGLKGAKAPPTMGGIGRLAQIPPIMIPYGDEQLTTGQQLAKGKSKFSWKRVFGGKGTEKTRKVTYGFVVHRGFGFVQTFACCTSRRSVHKCTSKKKTKFTTRR